MIKTILQYAAVIAMVATLAGMFAPSAGENNSADANNGIAVCGDLDAPIMYD